MSLHHCRIREDSHDPYGLFQLHPVLESLANALEDNIVAVRVGVESDGLQGIDIHFAILHLVGLNGCLQHLTDDTQSYIIILVFNELTLHRNGQLVDDGSIHRSQQASDNDPSAF